MQRRTLIALSVGWTFVALVAFAPLVHAESLGHPEATTAQLSTGESIYSQIDRMLSNLTKRFDVSPLAPFNQLAPTKEVTPDVKIANVKTISSAQSGSKPQVIVTLRNGHLAMSGVRVGVFYRSPAGVNVLSESSLTSLNADEMRSIRFLPNGLADGSYTIGTVVYKDGTDPSNKATPPYDIKENAATFVIANPTPSVAPITKAPDPGSKTSGFGSISSRFDTWILFIIAITTLITIALFFVFSQNRSGEDRFEEDHFNHDGSSLGNSRTSSLVAGSQASSRETERVRHEMLDETARPHLSQIAIGSGESASDKYVGTKAHDFERSTDNEPNFDVDGFVVGDVSSKKALRNKIKGKKGA